MQYHVPSSPLHGALALTCPLHGDEQWGLGLPASQPVSGHHCVLELGTLRPPQGLCVIHKQGPCAVLGRGDDTQGTTIGTGKLQPVLHVDAGELLAAFHTNFPNLGMGHRVYLSWVAGLAYHGGWRSSRAGRLPGQSPAHLAMAAHPESPPSMAPSTCLALPCPNHHTTTHPAPGA